MRAFVTKNKSVLWVAGALLLAGSSYYVLHQEESRSACQAQYNAAFTQQAAIRSRLSAASDKAQTDLISGVGALTLAPPSKDPKVLKQRGEAYLKLFKDFNLVVAQVEKDCAATPLPVTPNC